MLVTYSAFASRQAVRNSNLFLQPPLSPSQDILTPKDSVFHWFDPENHQEFPSRSLAFLREVDKAKRVPVYNVRELTCSEFVAGLLDKTTEKRTREWIRANIKQFKLLDLQEVKNPDNQTPGIVNYNLLPGMYRYQETLFTPLIRFNNLQTTYWDTVHVFTEKHPDLNHFVRFEVPNNLPSKKVLETILNLTPTRYMKVVTSPSLRSIIDLYRWIHPDTRMESNMKNLTDENAKSVIVEFSHRGYSTYFRLSDLISLSSASLLESKKKLNKETFLRMFILITLSVQKQAFALVQAQEKSEQVNTTTLVDPEEQLTQEEPAEEGSQADSSTFRQSTQTAQTDQTTDSKFGQAQTAQEEPSTGTVVEASVGKFLRPKDSPDLPNFDDALEQNLASLIDSSDTSDFTDVDAFFASAVAKVSQESVRGLKDTITTEEVLPIQPSKQELLRDSSVQENLDCFLKEAREVDSISSTEARSLKKTFEQRKVMKSPFSDQLFDAAKIVRKEDLIVNQTDLNIPMTNNLVEDSLKSEKLFHMDKVYVEKILNKHIQACVGSLEKGNIVIKDYQVEKNISSLGGYEIHKLTLKPYNGKESSVYFRTPMINEEGEFMASGIKYRMRKLRTDLVIRKTSPTRVSITTNYGKLFISRTERKNFDEYAWMVDKIKQNYLSESRNVLKLVPGNTFDNHRKGIPNAFAQLQKNFRSLKTENYEFMFDLSQQENHVPASVIKDIQNAGYLFCGVTTEGANILVMDKNSIVHNFTKKEEIGSIEELIGLTDTSKKPRGFTVAKILGDNIPMGIILSYYMGLKALLHATDTVWETTDPGKRVGPEKDILVLQFSDHKLLINTDTEEKRLLFNGFLFYKDFLKQQSLSLFDDKSIYLSLIEERGASLIHLKELETLRDYLIDPISEEVLLEMNEPTEYLPLLLKANFYLSDFSHPDINDPEFSRIRGYDRVPGLMYRALTESIRTYRIKGTKRAKIELDPYKVWNAITQDSTVKITEDVNPIVDVKEVESATFSGSDGLSKNATPVKMRKYHKNDQGLISEATVDSSDVALNFFLSPYSKMGNLLGMLDPNQEEVTDKSKIYSTSAQLAPFVEQDD